MVSTDPRRAAAKAALDRGNTLFHGPDWRDSRGEYETAHDLYRLLGDTGGLADALCNLASLAWRMSDLDRADHLYDQARDLYLGLEAWWHVAKVEQYRGNVAYDRGDLHRTRWLYHRARYALHDGNHPLDLADIDVNLAAVLGELGDHAAALDLLDEAEHLYRATLTDDALAIKIAEVEQNRGLAHLDHGDLARAWHHLAAALRTRRRLGDRQKAADLLHNLANTAARLRRFPTARALYERAIALYAEVGDDHAAADCHLGLGGLLRRDGNLDDARAHLHAAATAYAFTGEWLALARARHNLALMHPADAPSRVAALIPAWLAMQSIAWGLPEVTARTSWRHTLDDATASGLDAALACGDALLTAEIIEALRSAPLAPTAAVPAGVSTGGTTVHDLPTIRPAALDCGWPPVLLDHLTNAENIRNIGGTAIRLRTATTSLRLLLH